MPAVFLAVARPSLAAALVARGLAPARLDAADLAIVADGGPGLDLPALVLVPDADRAAALLDEGTADVALWADGDALIAARAAALARRIAGRWLRAGGLVVDTAERRVWRESRPVALLPREYALLLHLLRHAGCTVAREALLAQVWGLDFDPGTNVIAVHVSRLRARLDHGFARTMLVTDRGRGYRLVVDGPAIARRVAAV